MSTSGDPAGPKLSSTKKANHKVVGPHSDNSTLDDFDPLSQLDQEIGSRQNFVHIRIFQRTGRKSVTRVEGLPPTTDFRKVLAGLQGPLCCGGSLVQDKEAGTVLQLNGDHRAKVKEYLIEKGITPKHRIQTHGY